MTFLNPQFLWFSLAIAIPIIVHLFNFRKPKRILFSNLNFIKEVHKSVQKRLKLKQWLLLLSRILAILALVFAFANPIINNEQSNLTALKSNKSIVIFIDNSFSMKAADAQGEYLEQAKYLTKQIIQSYSNNDEFQLQTTGKMTMNASFSNKNELLSSLEDLTIKDKALPYIEILQNLQYYFTNASYPVRELYVLSDFQTSTMLKDSILSLPSEAKSIQTNFIPIGNQKPFNVYVSNIELKEAFVEKNKPVTLKVNVNNDSEKALENVSIKTFLNGTAMGIASVNLGPNESKFTEVTFTPQTGGWQSGKISLDDSPIDFDNTRFFSLFVPENQNLLIVEGAEKPEYVNLLFSNLARQFQTKIIDEKQLSNEVLSDYEGIILAGASQLSTGLSDKLIRWINEGGGMMFFPSENMNKNEINAFYQKLGVGQFTSLNTYQNPVKLNVPDLSHQIFESVFQQAKKNQEFDSPQIFKIYTFLPTDNGIQSTILTDKKNHIFLHESKIGAGTVFTYGISPTLTWSDFPIKSSFVPILYRCTLIMSSSPQTQLSQIVGNTNPTILKTKNANNTILKLSNLDPENKYEFIPQQVPNQGKLLLKYDKSDVISGNYGIYSSDSVIRHISFNYSDQESKLATANVDQLKEHLEKNQCDFVQVLDGSKSQKLMADLEMQQSGFPLWKYFLSFCFFMILAEIAILKLIKS